MPIFLIDYPHTFHTIGGQWDSNPRPRVKAFLPLGLTLPLHGHTKVVQSLSWNCYAHESTSVQKRVITLTVKKVSTGCKDELVAGRH